MTGAIDQPAPRRFGPSFTWGVAAGVLAVAVVIVSVVAVQIVAARRRGGSSGPRVQVVVSPEVARGDWFSVAPNGRGTLRGWATGNGGGGGVEGIVGEFDVGAVGAVNGTKIVHTVRVYVTRDTKILIGGHPYKNDRGIGPDEVMSDPAFLNRQLTINFHRLRTIIVADRIDAARETALDPLHW